MCQKLLDLLRTLRMKNVEGKVKEGEPRHSLDTLAVMLETFTHKLWYRTGLKELVEGDRDKVESRNLWGGKIIGLDPELQVHCYRKGHFFGTRLDKEKRINLTVNNEKKKAKKSWTLLLYLTCPGKGYQGGKTVFLSGKTRGDSAEELQVEFKIGTLLMFRRGQDGLQHKDYEVDEGEKWIVEIDLCIGE